MAAMACLTAPLAAQQSGAAATGSDVVTTIGNAQRSMVTRADLQAALDEITRQLASSGYSAAIRDAKTAQANAIRERLANGDMKTGDLIQLTLTGDGAGLTGWYAVNQNLSLSLPGGIEIPMRGILRSEVQDHLTKQIRNYVRDPILRAQTAIRVTLTGGVTKTGFFNVPTSALLSEVLMGAGGGPAGNANYAKSTVKRGSKVVVEGVEFEAALRDGKTIDQLSLQAGDEVNVATKSGGSILLKAAGVVSAFASIIYLGVQIF